jgi:hypothetical protein
MAAYRIVCTTLKNVLEHRHIVEVGTGFDPKKATRQWTVEDVRGAIVVGDVFYTQDGAGNQAEVSRYDCPCGYKTIRSAADATAANNLDNLHQCDWS